MARLFRLAPLLVVALAFAVTGCGSSSDSSSSDAGSTSAAATTTAASSGADDQFAAIKAEVEKLETRPTQIPQTTPIEGQIPSDKTIDWLQCGVPSCVAIGDALKEAAGLLGWKVNVLNAGLTPEELKAAFDQAVRDKPDAVITTGGFDRGIYRGELEQLKKDGVPVVSNADAVPPAPDEGIIATPSSEDWHSQIGATEAKWVIAQSNGTAHALIPASTFPIQDIQIQAFRKEFAQDCPKCKLTTFPVALESIGKDLPDKIAQQLQAHPDIDYLVAGFADMIVGLPAALAGAGVKKIPVITPEPNAVTYQDIRHGDITAAMNNSAPEGMWGAVDMLVRYFMKLPYDKEPAQAHWLITKDNLPADKNFPTVAGFKDQFKKLWGVG